MPRIDGHLVELRNHTVDAKGLIAQLAGFYHLRSGLCRGGQRLDIGQVAGGHIPMLAVRAGDLIPTGGGLRQHDDLCALLVPAQDFVPRASTRAQTQRVPVGAHPVHHAAGGGLRSELDLWRHRCRDRRSHNIPFHEALPFASLIQRVNNLQLILTVERLLHQRRGGGDCADTVAGKIGAVRGINAEHRASPLSKGHKKSASEETHCRDNHLNKLGIDRTV